MQCLYFWRCTYLCQWCWRQKQTWLRHWPHISDRFFRGSFCSGNGSVSGCIRGINNISCHGTISCSKESSSTRVGTNNMSCNCGRDCSCIYGKICGVSVLMVAMKVTVATLWWAEDVTAISVGGWILFQPSIWSYECMGPCIRTEWWCIIYPHPFFAQEVTAIVTFGRIGPIIQTAPRWMVWAIPWPSSLDGSCLNLPEYPMHARKHQSGYDEGAMLINNCSL